MQVIIYTKSCSATFITSYTHLITKVKITQFVNKMCSQIAYSKAVNKF